MKCRPTITSLALIALLITTKSATAEPISGTYIDRSDGCDAHGPLTFADELGDHTVFPTNEAIMVTALPDVGQLVCTSGDGVANDWRVRMFNASGQDWRDVFFVADQGITFSNFDGEVTDTTFSPPVGTLAMRIDNLGANPPLVAGDIDGDNIFDAGETWDFHVDDFVAPNPGGPTFFSVGQFAGSSGLNIDSTASIVVNPVPEPVSAGLLTLGLLAVVIHRRRSM